MRILPDLIQSNSYMYVLINEKKEKKQRKNIEEFGPDIENAFRFAYKCSYSDVIYFKVTIVGSVYPNFVSVL